MVAQLVACRRAPLSLLRVTLKLLPDQEEGSLNVLLVERLQHLLGVARCRTVVKGKSYDLSLVSTRGTASS